MVPTSKGQIWKSALQDILSQTAIYKALTNTILTSKNPVKGIKKYADRGRVIDYSEFQTLGSGDLPSRNAKRWCNWRRH